ncbi:MAG TPA: 50S ribosomal protein L6 [Patescibacteria group bacterium]|nr:50S ribosomal protein L6 [Patescibacteria group bacterium]
MSKIGKLPIMLESGVQATVSGNTVQITGTKGNVSYTVPSGITVAIADGKVTVDAPNKKDRKVRALYGLTRANLANIIKGVDRGFEKKLELVGVGYRSQLQGTDLVLSLGFSHPVKIKPLPGITISVADNVITISGSDKQQVGLTAANIRAIKPPEPYKGKGIKYVGERIRRKAGKAAKAAGAK